MSKIFETEQSIKDMVEERFADAGLEELGLTLKVMSVKKQKEVVKVKKASDDTEFLINKTGSVLVFIYEEVFNRLDEEIQTFLIDTALSNVSYNSEKDRIVIDSNPYNCLFKARKKIGDRADEMLEASYLAIQQYEDGSVEE